MATGISNAERLPDADYSVAHRSPPPIPAAAGSTYSTIPPPSPPPPSLPQHLKHPPPKQPTNESESENAGADNPPRRRRGSLSSILRRNPSSRNTSRQRSASASNSTNNAIPPSDHHPAPENVPPVPFLPHTRIGQVHQDQQAAQVQAQSEERTVSAASARKPSNDGGGGGGRNMLRKVSRSARREERERQEQERLERANAPAPRLPSHHPLPGIQSFGGDDSTAPINNIAIPSASPTNFSRPSNHAYASMPSSSYANSSSSPAYALRGTPSSPHQTNGEYVHRQESITNRSRYSYSSSVTGNVNVNSPRRVRRRKDPTPFNVLVIGAKNSGKTSFISFLRHSLALPANKGKSLGEGSTVHASKSSFTSHYLETEMEGERVGVTLWDSAGLEKNIADLQLREMSAFVESKFEETFVEEQKVQRSPGVKDTHIHCAFLILDPVRLDAAAAASSAFQDGSVNLAAASGLDEDIDLQVLQSLWGKTTVIPVIAKADTLTVGHMSFLKRAVWQSIKKAKMDPLEALELEDDNEEDSEAEAEDEDSDLSSFETRSDADSDSPPPRPSRKSAHKRVSSTTSLSRAITNITLDDNETPYIPMSILSPDPYDLPPFNPKPQSEKPGRRFPWGLADPLNAAHCDFARLRDSVFLEWRPELRELSRSKWYENWRFSRLKNLPASSASMKQQRAKGGVTPVGSIPREGMSSPRQFSPPPPPSNQAVPRSVSATTTTNNNPSLSPPLEGGRANGSLRGVAAKQ